MQARFQPWGPWGLGLNELNPATSSGTGVNCLMASTVFNPISQLTNYRSVISHRSLPVVEHTQHVFSEGENIGKHIYIIHRNNRFTPVSNSQCLDPSKWHECRWHRCSPGNLRPLRTRKGAPQLELLGDGGSWQIPCKMYRNVLRLTNIAPIHCNIM